MCGPNDTIQTSQLLPCVLVPTIHPHEVSLLHEIGVSIWVSSKEIPLIPSIVLCGNLGQICDFQLYSYELTVDAPWSMIRVFPNSK